MKSVAGEKGSQAGERNQESLSHCNERRQSSEDVPVQVRREQTWTSTVLLIAGGGMA